MNRVAVPLGLKLFSVSSIRSQDITAAAAPAPKAQSRIAPVRLLPRPPAVLFVGDETLGFWSAISDGGIGVESCVSIGSALSSFERQADRSKGDTEKWGDGVLSSFAFDLRIGLAS
jgi:hypothetical protein